jgi:hypothetical protein
MLIINQIKKNFGVIHSSNLCAEIMEVTDKDTTAICTLHQFRYRNLLLMVYMILMS